MPETNATSGGALRGRLAYIRNGAAWVAPLAGGPATRLPRSEGAERVYLSPKTSAALVFTAAPTGARGWLVPPPYREARPLAYPLDSKLIPDVVWSGDGEIAFCLARDTDGVSGICGAYRVGTNNWTTRYFSEIHSASRDGSLIAWAAEGSIYLGWPGTGDMRVLFSSGRPEAMIDALARAKRPDRIRDILDLDRGLLKNRSNWQNGAPALTPDGKTVFFASNLGQGMGAAGNTTFVYFAADIATGGLSVLSKLGTFFGRTPSGAGECVVSPDGARLLSLTSLHNMAVDNPSSVHVVDLLTQAERDLLNQAPHRRDDTNLIEGAGWSADGRVVAVSVFFYRVADVMRRPHWEPRPGDYTLHLFDARTGRLLRRIPGAIRPAMAGQN